MTSDLMAATFFEQIPMTTFTSLNCLELLWTDYTSLLNSLDASPQNIFMVLTFKYQFTNVN